MKRNFFIIPLVLMSAAFMWSCQGQLSAPLTGPENPGFATKPGKGGNGGGGGKAKATFDVEIFFDGILVATRVSAVATSKETQLPANDTNEETVLELASGLGACFPAGTYVGQVAVHSGDTWTWTTYFGNQDGNSFNIDLHGGNPGDWLPATSNTVSGTSVDVTFATGKGKKKVECTETVSQDWSVKVTRN